jgi:hypothetical protein
MVSKWRGSIQPETGGAESRSVRLYHPRRFNIPVAIINMLSKIKLTASHNGDLLLLQQIRDRSGPIETPLSRRER